MSLQTILSDLSISQAAFARGLALPKSSACQIVKHGEWPARGAEDVKRRAIGFLVKSGASAQHLALMREAGLFPKPPMPAAAAASNSATQPSIDKEDPMLLELVTLTAEAKKHFGLTRSPFVDDINVRADVFASPSTRYVRAAMLDAALHHGFIAVVGESGSGKTTLREELEERIREEQRPIHIIKPYIVEMEPSESRGKPLTTGNILDAIVNTLAPTLKLPSAPQARAKKIHELLAESAQTGARHLIVIEEAHRLPLSTLKHLKSLMELKHGLRRLLGVCLMGQPELGTLLSEQRQDIREIVQRCEKIRLDPLDGELEAYLKHKFARIDVKASDVFADDAYDAFRARMIHTPRGGRSADVTSMCYPLAVNNRVTRAMNAAAAAGWPKVDAQVVAGC